MKKMNILFISLFILLAACSSGNDSSKTLPSGASAVFDAENPSGNRSIPATGCSLSTWVNTANTSANGTIDCSLGGGYAGNGIFTSPYRFEFNGTSTTINTSVNAQPSAMTTTTWIVWVNPSSLNFSHILSIDNHLGAFNRSLVIQNSNWSAFTGTNTTFEGPAADMNSWQHIAVVYKQTGITIYKNGTGVSYNVAPTINNTAQTLAIGHSAGGGFDYFAGAIAWVGIYPRELSAAEIKSSCRALANRFDAVVCAN